MATSVSTFSASVTQSRLMSASEEPAGAPQRRLRKVNRAVFGERRELYEGCEVYLPPLMLGSFEGARCEPVAKALRVCYEEYSPLRFGGDLIFRVLKRVVNGRLLKK